jgi:SagB-type dehydrogenase family enzyme
MRKSLISLIRLTIAAVLVYSYTLPGQELKPVPLPKPQRTGGTPLMDALNERKSGREFSPEALPSQVLSNLLWAAFGVNRPDGKRTAPSASNRQDIDIYVALAEGLYLYDHRAHALHPVLKGDVRAATGTQSFVREAPVNLVYVADRKRMGTGSEENMVFYSAINTGYISQNVYLYCASEGLATVARGLVDRPSLTEAMKLRPEQRIVLTQSIGYPAKK